MIHIAKKTMSMFPHTNELTFPYAFFTKRKHREIPMLFYLYYSNYFNW